VEVGGARAARVGAEEDLGAIEAQRVVHGVEHLGGHQVPRQEHARAGEGRRPPPPGGTCRAGDVGRRHRRVAGAGAGADAPPTAGWEGRTVGGGKWRRN